MLQLLTDTASPLYVPIKPWAGRPKNRSLVQNSSPERQNRLRCLSTAGGYFARSRRWSHYHRPVSSAKIMNVWSYTSTTWNILIPSLLI